VECVGRVLKVGRSIAVAQVELRAESSGALVAVGRHSKFVAMEGTDVRPSAKSKL
jgi:acyl-coenzyme A thioesterase PaaI-like protein